MKEKAMVYYLAEKISELKEENRSTMELGMRIKDLQEMLALMGDKNQEITMGQLKEIFEDWAAFGEE